MPNQTLIQVPDMIREFNDTSRFISTTINTDTISMLNQTTTSITRHSDISLLACIGFIMLILTTVCGNTLVLAAIVLDKRLHTPSFLLIANMAIADVLLGIFVLPFSSVLELLNNRWIFGQSFCSAWLAIDVLCCTASIIGLAGVSIDRYIGVTQALKYRRIMTIRRTIYLIIIIWALSILTSVVPLFGLTDRGTITKARNSSNTDLETCEVNKDTFYSIFSSMISFYIPLIVLLILYSRVYQEAKKQGQQLEKERRRLYQIDYERAAENARQQQNQSNGSLLKNQSNDNNVDEPLTLVNAQNNSDEESTLDHTLISTNGNASKKDYNNRQNTQADDLSRSDSSLGFCQSRIRHLLGKRLFSALLGKSNLHTSNFLHSSHNHLETNDELAIIKRKLHNLRAEKKAFRTVGLILSALLICWLPFFVTLPVTAILKHNGIIKNEEFIDIWFKIAFWLGYCNSALNPFVYAFSNRAIRRAFREIIFRRICFCCPVKKNSNQTTEKVHGRRRHRTLSGSITTELSQTPTKRASLQSEPRRMIPRVENHNNKPSRNTVTSGPVVSFATTPPDTDINHSTTNDEPQLNSKIIATS